MNVTSATVWLACADATGLVDVGDDYELQLPTALESGQALIRARDAGLEEAEGGRLLLRLSPTPAKDMLSTDVGGQRVAAWPRVFSDLRTIGVRGEEAAAHLRSQSGGSPKTRSAGRIAYGH